VRVLRQLPETLLEASRSIERITLETIAGGERLVGHRLEHLLHREDAGRVARLLLRCSKLGDPVSDRTFVLFMRRDLCRSLTLLRLASGTRMNQLPRPTGRTDGPSVKYQDRHQSIASSSVAGRCCDTIVREVQQTDTGDVTSICVGEIAWRRGAAA
jgi:hypothetical protein